MVEIVSWVMVAFVAVFALVGFVGVVVTSAMTVVRYVRHSPAPAEVADERHYASAA